MRAVRALAATIVLASPAVPASAHVPRPGEPAAKGSLSAPRPLGVAFRQAAEPASGATPGIPCREGSKPELGLQGRLAKEDVDAGRAAEGFWCNLRVIGRSGSTGGFRVHRYIDEQGRECAYYDTALLFPTNALSLSGEPTGVAVLDMTDPAKPVRTTTLLTPAMQTPHESLNISVQRGVLAAVLGNPSAYPGGIDVYDISEDCRNPQLMTAVFPGSDFGHESGMSPDGLTFWPTSIGTGETTAVDIANPRLPVRLWEGQFNTHGMSVSDDGKRAYFATGDGLVIADTTEIQERKPDPTVREISRLTWPTMTVPQVAIPVTIKGRPYLVEIDEYSSGEDGDGVAAHGPRVGAARIIDIADEAKPRVVSNIRLAVHQPEHRAAIAGDYGTSSPVQGYAGHYCNVPRRVDPGIVACSMILSGLRVFDIRDPERPKEIAYHVAAPSTVSATGGPVIDENANFAMSQPAFAPERGEIWYSDGTSGFYALRMDPAVWPFPAETTSSGCVDNRGLGPVGVRGARGGLRFTLARRARLPVTVDVFRVSDGRRVLRERRVARFAGRTGSFAARLSLGPGVYFARFRMVRGGRTYDTARVTFARTRGGVRPRRAHHRREGCSLLRLFKLERPVFGGTTGAPLRIAYRLLRDAEVTVTVLRGAKVVRRFGARRRTAGRTFRLSLPSRALARGEHRVQLRAVAGEEQVLATLYARRL